MILGFVAIIYIILCTFNIMKADEEKIYWLWMGTMVELIIFDLVIYNLLRRV